MRMRSHGYTLVELLTTLSVIGILLGVGLPNLTGHVHNLRVKNATQSLLESLEFTRSRAVFYNKRTTIRKQSNWEHGWEVFIDSNNNGTRDPDETALQTQSKLKGVKVVANSPVANYVSYIASGEGRYASGTNNAGAFQAGRFTICPKAKGTGYELIIARSGRIRTHEIDADACAAI